jgi:hypothetical protein
MNKLWANLLIRYLKSPSLSTFTFPHESVYAIGYNYITPTFSIPRPHDVYVWSFQICSSCRSVSTDSVFSTCLSVPTCATCKSPVSKVSYSRAQQINFALAQLTTNQCMLIETTLLKT